ncbi:unnamed protein product [Candidula unifasciata]|uniref:G-protein coupled receptors family 1 profile domain-containing protein n=1 Tax=Candidula unifasciata TaxID=100452 RepID=A0A8S4A509_9EUPU|nr:unnamed protein product [Candidula unifasciata]
MEIFNATDLSYVKSITDDIILISAKTLSYFTVINGCVLGQCLAIFGLIVNLLNIVVFVRQGLQDPVNISLLGLSVSDLASLFVHFFSNLCWTPAIMRMDLPFYPTQLMYFLVWIHVIFSRVTAGITAWITFERCVCIVCPLKIKSIVTPQRTVNVICVLYVTMCTSTIPVFYSTRAVWIFDPRRNRSILGIARITHSEYIQQIAFWINNILPITFFVFITTCTIILVKSLKKISKWKQQSAYSQNPGLISQRDTKVVRMITIISIVFIACYTPGAVLLIFILIFPELTYSGKQKNLLVVILSILVQLEGINATANFFIYFTMSSKFKRTLISLFCAYGCKMKQRLESSANKNLKN